ncbi:unnamed protein product [Onchocerca flexuosa]|uniref:Sulfate_transp domain-containing protein n=1 Tax=Onchocerca flexuosa TaxID=387005 RepID=A0A183HZE0_9BILA|nr:unnamed protein product [Onchocerca flexuosa]
MKRNGSIPDYIGVACLSLLGYYAVNDPVFGSLMFGSLIQCLGPGVLQSEYCLVMFSSKLLIHCKFRPLCIA